MSAQPPRTDPSASLEITRQIDAVCDEFEIALRRSGDVAIGQYLGRVEAPGRKQLIAELAVLALDQLRAQGAPDPVSDLLTANAEIREELDLLSLSCERAITVAANEKSNSLEKHSGLRIHCPHCHCTVDMSVDASLEDIGCSTCGGVFSLVNQADETHDATALTKIAHFELLNRLGMGGFGTVWKARDTILDRTVALKIPRRESVDALSIEKFMREARAAAQLKHPNIVGTHEVGRHEDTLYIVSDYIRGVSLADAMADHRLTIRDTVNLTITVADALAHAHRSGVVHRDLKPSNILIDGKGEPHLMDFGLAKRKEIGITMTTEGAILGTPAYMSPEQARGEGSQVDGRSDIYSVGVIIFQLLTGELPFRGSVRILLEKVIHDDPPGPRSLEGRVPRDLDTICLKCLEKEPSRRYTTAEELAADLRRFQAGEPVVARRVGPVGKTIKWMRRNHVVTILLASIIATMLTAAIVSTYFGLRAADNAVRADQQARAATDTLYDSIVQSARLTRQVRQQGYGTAVEQLIDRARTLPTGRVDKDQLRRELVLSMGDFVAYSPVVISPAGHTTSVCFNEDGTEIVAGLDTGQLLLYDARTGQKRFEFEAFAGLVQSTALIGDRDRLSAVDHTGEARVWQWKDGSWILKQTYHMAGNSNESVFTFSTNGELVTHLNGSRVETWDAVNGKKLHSFSTQPTWKMCNAAFDLLKRRLVCGYLDSSSHTAGWATWNLDTGERGRVIAIGSLGDTYPNSIGITHDGSRMALGFDEALLIYDMGNFEQNSLFGLDATKAVSFSPTHPYLAAVNIRGGITIWNSVTNRQLAALQNVRQGKSRENITFSADGSHLAASNSSSISIWDLTRADERIVMTGHDGGIPCASFSRDGKELVTGGKDERLRFWDPSSGRSTRTATLDEAAQALAFTDDGKILAVGSMGRTNARHLRLLDAQSNEVLHEADAGIGEMHSLAWADRSDGRYLAACGSRGVGIWRIKSISPVDMEEVLKLERKRCLAITFNHGGSYVVWAQDDSSIHAWDVGAAREKELHAPPMLQGWHGLAFLPDNESVMYVSKSGTAQVWSIKEDRSIKSFGATGTFNAPHIAISPNGKLFAGLAQPDSVSVWDISTGNQLFSLRPEACTIWSLAWDSSSTKLAVGQSDGGLAVWYLPKIERKLSEMGLPEHKAD